MSNNTEEETVEYTTDDESDYDITTPFEQNDELFPMESHIVKNQANRDVEIFTVGEVIGNHIRITLESLHEGLTTYRDHLLRVKNEDKAHGVTQRVAQEIHDLLVSVTELHNKCNDIIEKL